MSPPTSGANPRGPTHAGRASPTPSPPLPLESSPAQFGNASRRQRITAGTKSQRNRGPGTSRWHCPLSSEGTSERRQYPWLAEQPVMHGRRRSVLASESRAYRRQCARYSRRGLITQGDDGLRPPGRPAEYGPLATVSAVCVPARRLSGSALVGVAGWTPHRGQDGAVSLDSGTPGGASP